MAVPIVMPKLGMVMSEGTIVRWTKSAGDSVKQGEVIAEIETEKLNYDLEATDGGIFHPVSNEGESVPVDGLLGYLLEPGEALPVKEERGPSPTEKVNKPKQPIKKPPASESRVAETVRSTPGARRLADKLGVEITLVTPTGPGGRVVEGDVRMFSEQADIDQGAGKTPLNGLPEPSSTTALSGMRKSIASHMHKSLRDTAQLSFFLELDVTEAQNMRRTASQEGATITLGDVFAKACVGSLQRYPILNTVLSNDTILEFKQINLAFAVNLADGLIVPVIQEANKKSLAELSSASRDLAKRAETGSLTPDDVTGGTFTISVLGSVDGFTPILNAGQTGILGVGKTTEKPVARKKEIVLREMVTVSLTVDHQVVDGAVAAAFLRRLQRLVETPGRLFK